MFEEGGAERAQGAIVKLNVKAGAVLVRPHDAPLSENRMRHHIAQLERSVLVRGPFRLEFLVQNV